MEAARVGKFLTELQKKHLTANIYGTEDLIIELKYCKWAVHQKKLEDASDFFKAALQPGQWKEAREGSMRLPDDDPIMFARLVQFLYLGLYRYDSRPGTGWSNYITRVTENSDLRYLVTGDSGCPALPLETCSETPNAVNLDEANIPEYIRQGPHIYKRQHDRDSNMTQQEQDLEADMNKTRAQVDMEMYVLADKYIIPSLKEFVLAELEHNIDLSPRIYAKPEYISLLRYINESFIVLEGMDERVKKLLARFIARHYKSIRLGEHVETNKILYGLLYNHNFSLMIMD